MFEPGFPVHKRKDWLKPVVDGNILSIKRGISFQSKSIVIYLQVCYLQYQLVTLKCWHQWSMVNVYNNRISWVCKWQGKRSIMSVRRTFSLFKSFLIQIQIEESTNAVFDSESNQIKEKDLNKPIWTKKLISIYLQS